jgi:hypothetical protein
MSRELVVLSLVYPLHWSWLSLPLKNQTAASQFGEYDVSQVAMMRLQNHHTAQTLMFWAGCLQLIWSNVAVLETVVIEPVSPFEAIGIFQSHSPACFSFPWTMYT